MQMSKGSYPLHSKGKCNKLLFNSLHVLECSGMELKDSCWLISLAEREPIILLETKLNLNCKVQITCRSEKSAKVVVKTCKPDKCFRRCIPKFPLVIK